jgi:hypothetical protein
MVNVKTISDSTINTISKNDLDNTQNDAEEYKDEDNQQKYKGESSRAEFKNLFFVLFMKNNPKLSKHEDSECVNYF